MSQSAPGAPTPAQTGPDLAPVLAWAATVLRQVHDGHNLTRALGQLWQQHANAPAAARAAVHDITHATLREHGPVNRIIDLLCQRGRPAAPVYQLLCVTLQQLRRGRRTDHALVNAAVDACRKLGAGHATGLVNAVLRRYLREKAALEGRLAADTSPAIQYSWPDWWIVLLQRQYPDAWEQILAESMRHPPMTLRFNLRQTTVADSLAQLADAGLTVRAADVGQGWILEEAVPVERLPGFREGRLSVQDAGAQLAAGFLDVKDGLRVLDACAAPGGKTAHLLEIAAVNLTAVELNPDRLASIQDTLARLHLTATVVAGDASTPATWWDGTPYDRILADVPCSASGVTRRHPDIRLLRRPADITRFCNQQAAILDALWPCLAVGGKLLYVTCSVLEEENQQQIRRFVDRHPDARQAPLPGRDASELQLLPARDHDGFYYALLEKRG